MIALIPRGAISRRIYDRNGDAVTNATVQAFKYAYREGRRALVSVDSARSNGLGEYRFFWLAPGSRSCKPGDVPGRIRDLDEIRIYDHALSASEMAALANPSAVPEPATALFLAVTACGLLGHALRRMRK